MGITIKEVNPRNTMDLNQVDGVFTIDGRLVLQVEDDQIRYKVVETPKQVKRYRIDPIDPASFLNDPDKTAFLAYMNGQIAGQIILRVNWNQYAFIEDIAVDVKFRRQGVGRELIMWAEGWARERDLAGIMLETQNNNLSACKFYEGCGFQLSGFDRSLYRGIDPETDEVALYWYLFF